MPDEPYPQPEPHELPKRTEDFGTIPHSAEGFHNVPPDAAPFGTMPKPAETFRDLPNASAAELPESHWRETYTLTVREVARLFEGAGVARSERSIVNWCQRNRQGVARLDAYFDPNERRYFITRQSVEAVIAEEKARAAKANAEPVPPPAEVFGNGPSADQTDAEPFRNGRNQARPEPASNPESATELAELRKENLDLKITNRGKDFFIEQLQKEREILLNKLVDASQLSGRLEAELKKPD